MAGVRPEGANSSRAEDRATEFCPNLSAKAVNARLKQSLEALRHAEKSAVLWFAEVMQRKLYRDLGYSSIHQYAELELGFKKARISQFIRLSEAFRELPKLMESVARGDVSCTKAREVSGVATQETESAWIAEAQKSTSRELEQKVAITRQRAKAVRSGAAAQGELEATEATETVVPRVFEPPADVPADLHYRLSPIQLTRYEALVEKLRKLGAEGSREELMLECMEIAVEVRESQRKARTRERDESTFPRGNSALPERDAESAGQDAGSAGQDAGSAGQDAGSAGQDAGSQGGNTRTARSAENPGTVASGGNTKTPYQVTVWMCGGCGAGSVETSRGPRKLAPATLKAILCDAMVRKRGKRNRSVLPERVRRQIMERDRMRCRGAGCNRTRFLSVHHLHPREAGGVHDLENLVLLCDPCHRAAHRHPGPLPLRKAPSREALMGKVVDDRDLVRDRSGSYSVKGMGDRARVHAGAGIYKLEAGHSIGSSDPRIGLRKL